MTRDTFTGQTLKEAGFEGFLAVTKLVGTRCSEVSSEPGVYAVVRSQVTEPRFRSKSHGGWFKGKNPTASLGVLRDRWVAETDVLYLGRAKTSLRGRVRDLVAYGTGRPVAHQGGRYLWQVQGSEDFLVAWKSDGDPVSAEVQLQEAFIHAYGALPFANLRVG